jgi:hypothetical protein
MFGGISRISVTVVPKSSYVACVENGRKCHKPVHPGWELLSLSSNLDGKRKNDSALESIVTKLSRDDRRTILCGKEMANGSRQQCPPALSTAPSLRSKNSKTHFNFAAHSHKEISNHIVTDAAQSSMLGMVLRASTVAPNDLTSLA